MGFMMVLGECFACHRLFHFNPHQVPSFRGEPVCADCMARVNTKREAMGLAPHPILPGAYEPEEVAG